MALEDIVADATLPGLRIFRREAPVSVLGPGQRAVIWVQGCPFACKGCIVPESWPAQSGDLVTIAELAEWALAQEGIEGLTFSGGEPMEQAEGLSALVDIVRAHKNLGIVCYTGYRLEALRRNGSVGQRSLLARTDLLIDGVYIEREHADVRWRGSANQRLLLLTDRYRAEVETINSDGDCSAGLQFFIDEHGAFGFAGVPAQPGFRDTFESRLAARGVQLI